MSYGTQLYNRRGYATTNVAVSLTYSSQPSSSKLPVHNTKCPIFNLLQPYTISSLSGSNTVFTLFSDTFYLGSSLNMRDFNTHIK